MTQCNVFIVGNRERVTDFFREFSVSSYAEQQPSCCGSGQTSLSLPARVCVCVRACVCVYAFLSLCVFCLYVSVSLFSLPFR